MSKEYWFEWQGARSTEYGVYVDLQPPITRPNERVSFVNVPGRSGSLAKTEGMDVYDDITLTVPCVMKTRDRIQDIGKWLKGGGRVVFASRPNGFYYARVANQIPFEQVMRGRDNRNFDVIFRCKPFFYLLNEEEVTLNSPGSVMYEGSVFAQPVITVYGTGDGALMVGGTMIELTGLTGSITIDSMLEEAYDGQTDMNAHMSGDFPALYEGLNGVSWTGGITGVRVTKNTRFV